MKKERHNNSNNSLIKFTQYISGLAPNQNAWEEAGKAMVSFMNVYALVYARPDKDKDNGIVFTFPVFKNRDAKNKCGNLFIPGSNELKMLNENDQKVEKLVKETYESGFLNTTNLNIPDPVCFGFLPVTEENKISYVLILTSFQSEPFFKKQLNEFLAVAALIGNISGRLSTERELREHRWQLEKLVKERTEEIQQKNVLLRKEIEHRKDAENKVEHLNTVLRSINNVNQMMIREKDTGKMLEKTCEMLVNTRGYFNAWIAWFDQERKLIKAVESGVGKQFNRITESLESGNFTYCQQMAIRGKADEVIVITDPLEQCKDCPLSSSYKNRGAMTTVIRHGEKLYGLITVSLPLHFISEKEERVLLAEVAGGVAYALHDKELQKAHDEAVSNIRSNEQRLSQIVQGNSIATFVIDKNHVITHWNRAAERLTGINAGKLVGTNKQWKAFYKKERPVLADVIISKYPKKLLNKYYKNKYNKSSLLKNVYEAEDYFPDLGENGKWLYFTATPIKDEEGNVSGALETLQDYSELKKHEFELNGLNKELAIQNEEYLSINEELQQTNEVLAEAKKKAEESDRLKSAFLANMSHEIRTPMNGILGFADLLKEPELTGEAQQKYVNIIQRSGERMLNIINDLISISKIESGQMELILSETNINEVIDYLFTFFKQETDIKGLQLSVKNTLPLKESEIITDKEKLYAILTNLIKNAIKYTNRGSIEFGYILKGDEIEFFVKDSGIGIPEDKLESVFERFVQVDHSMSSNYEGAGLGLAITKSYVEMLGGKIWIKSGGNISGSVFYFTIPYRKKHKKIEKIEKEIIYQKNNNPMKDLTILIVEDEESSDLYLTELLKDKCKALLHASNGEEAVIICRENHNVDLVLLDIKMPVMDGYKAAGLIKKINKNIIIIAQTAYALTGDREKALAAGCDEYLSKPIKKADLMKILQEVRKGQNNSSLQHLSL